MHTRILYGPGLPAATWPSSLTTLHVSEFPPNLVLTRLSPTASKTSDSSQRLYILNHICPLPVFAASSRPVV